jgi:hypothetical protein
MGINFSYQLFGYSFVTSAYFVDNERLLTKKRTINLKNQRLDSILPQTQSFENPINPINPAHCGHNVRCSKCTTC